MTIGALLGALRERNIRIGVLDGELRVLDPDCNLNDALMQSLRQHKTELVELLSASPSSSKSDFPFATLMEAEVAELLRAFPVASNLYVATPMQTGLLFHGLLGLAGAEYTVQLYGDLVAGVDVAAFKAAWRALV